MDNRCDAIAVGRCRSRVVSGGAARPESHVAGTLDVPDDVAERRAPAVRSLSHEQPVVSADGEARRPRRSHPDHARPLRSLRGRGGDCARDRRDCCGVARTGRMARAPGGEASAADEHRRPPAAFRARNRDGAGAAQQQRARRHVSRTCRRDSSCGSKMR